MTINVNEMGVRYAVELTAATPEDVPIWDPKGLYKEWAESEIYFGRDKIGEGNNGRYVPNVGNKVFSEKTGTWVVSELDPTTLIPKLRKYVEPVSGGAGEKDYLLGVGPRYPEPGYFIYVDNNQRVPRVSLDAQSYFAHHAVAYFRAYAGTEISVNAEVISAWFDQSGNYRDDIINKVKIPAVESPDGLEHFTAEEFWATRKLIPGEPILLAAFSQENVVIAQTVFVVRDGSYVRRGNTPVRQISSIELICPYLSPNDTEDRIRIPTGTNIKSVVMNCRLTLNDGKTLDLPIDGTKIRVQGLEETVATSPGYLRDIILYYYLGEGEVYVGSQANDGSAMTRRYTVEVDPTQDTYGFKLFVFPSWIDEQHGYGLIAFLHDYDHSQVYDVTGMVELDSNSSEWDPLLYSKKQYLRFAIDVSKVDPRFSAYRHVQPMQFTLMAAGIADQDNRWRVYFENGQAPAYGDGCVSNWTFVSSQVWTVDISCQCKTYEQWLDKLYYRTLPMFDPQTESKPLEPTHFILAVEGQRYRHPVSDWNAVIQTKTAGTNGETAVIHWIRNTGQADLWLGTSGLAIKQIIPA